MLEVKIESFHSLFEEGVKPNYKVHLRFGIKEGCSTLVWTWAVSLENNGSKEILADGIIYNDDPTIEKEIVGVLKDVYQKLNWGQK